MRQSGTTTTTTTSPSPSSSPSPTRTAGSRTHHNSHNNINSNLINNSRGKAKASRSVPPIDATTGMDPNLERDDKYEIKSGKLLLLHKLGQRSCWLPVHVRVYRNAFEHFAVVSKDQAISTNSTYVNLRTATCGSSEDKAEQFKVVQNNYEGTVIKFDAGDRESVRDWVEAFTCATPPGSPTQQGGMMSPTLSPAIPRSPVMPTLPELEEEE